MVQEVITYLGSFIKGAPSIFDGIMRVRTHFFIIAMREEISAMMKCNEEEAIEHLMELSPFEMKSLMRQVLTAGDHVVDAPKSAGILSPDHTRHWPPPKLNTEMSSALVDHLTITAQSGGYLAGNFAFLSILRDGKEHPMSFIFGRGMNVIVMDPFEGKIVDLNHFDTNISKNDSEQFAKRIEWLDKGYIVVIITKDDFVENLTESAIVACENIGSAFIRDCHYRDSWCIIGEKGATKGSVPEFHRLAHMGPTEKIQHTLNLAEKREGIPEVAQNGVFSSLGSILPSGGRWSRRRKNDGALNRVPDSFYPKVWKILTKTSGIQVCTQILPSEPTVSESTPEEFNFGKFF